MKNYDRDNVKIGRYDQLSLITTKLNSASVS